MGKKPERTFPDLEMIGMAKFLFVALNYVKNVRPVRKKMEKKDWNFVLVLNAVDWPYAAAIHFTGHHIVVHPVDDDWLADKNNWDVVITATGKTFFDYFMSRIGVIRPILLGKMKVKGMLKILAVFWFVLTMLKVFKGNQALSEGFFSQVYPYYYAE